MQVTLAADYLGEKLAMGKLQVGTCTWVPCQPAGSRSM